MPGKQRQGGEVKSMLGAASTAPRQPLPPPKASKESQPEPPAKRTAKGDKGHA